MGLFPEGAIHRLCCPICKHFPLEVREEGQGDGPSLVCPACPAAYPLFHGIPHFVPQEVGRWRDWHKRLSQFDRRATGWTKQNAEERIPLMKELLCRFHKVEGSLLDIGCGDGEIRSFLDPVEYWGIDPEDWVTTPKHAFDKETLFPGIRKKFPLFLGVGEYLPFRDQTFDNVLIFTSLDHVQSPREVVRESFRVLKRGGFFLSLLQLSDLEYRTLEPPLRRLATSLGRGMSKLPRRDFAGFARGVVHTLFDRPDLSFTRKGIEELLNRYFLNFEIEILPGGDAFVKAMKP